MRNPVLSVLVGVVSFAAGLGVSVHVDRGSHRAGARAPSAVDVSYPAVAYAAGTCSVAPLVCANDTSPGCETICAGEQRATCVEGTCSAGGNVATPNHCGCK